MKKSFIDIIMNSTRNRIIQCLISHKQATTSEISDQLKDVSKATLYRHISILEKNKILIVTEEHKIRGTVEKVYQINYDIMSNKTKNVTNAKANVWNFFMNLYQDFDSYFVETNANMKEDRVFFSPISLNLTNQDYDNLVAELDNLIEKYRNVPQENNSKVRKLSIISSPRIKKE